MPLFAKLLIADGLLHLACGCSSELANLGHDLYIRMHPFQAPQHPADWLVLGRFGKNTQDRNDTLWCVPLSVELMIVTDMFHLPFLMHGNGLTSLGHDLHARMHPFQAPQCPAGGLVSGGFGRNALDRNDVSWCVALFME